VVSQLSSRGELLHTYLHALFLKDAHAGADFHEQQVSLYAMYDPKLLLPFLRQSMHYPLEKAYAICEQKGLYEEMVFILGRMGNAKQALKLIIKKLEKVGMAVEFVEQQKDEELWEFLITECLGQPKFVSELLEHIGAHVDPIKLIRRIPEGMEIENLRDRLVKIISDYNLQTALREGCKEILKADCVHLFERLFTGLRGGHKVDDIVKCATCNAAITNSKPESGIIIFFCQHVYHQRCLKSATPTSSATPTPPSPSVATTPSSTSANMLPSSAGVDGERVWCTICMSLQSKAKGPKGRILGQRKKV